MRIIEYHAHRYLPQATRTTSRPYGAYLLLAAGLACFAIAGLSRPAIWALLVNGDFIGSTATFGLQEDSPLVAVLLTVHHLIF